MYGPDCPICERESSIISTTNDYKYHCEHCDIRFGNREATKEGIKVKVIGKFFVHEMRGWTGVNAK